MNLLDLDSLSLREIILNLDMVSYKATVQACKRLYEVGKTAINMSKWKYTLQKLFVQLVSDGMNRDDFIAVSNYKDAIMKALRSLRSHLRFIEIVQHGISSKVLNLPTIILKLLRRALLDESHQEEGQVYFGPSNLQVLHHFRFTGGPGYYICIYSAIPPGNVEDKDNITMAIIRKGAVFEYYLYSNGPEFSSITDFYKGYNCSNDVNHLLPVCKELRKLFSPEDQNSITPEQLVALSRIDLRNEAQDSVFLNAVEGLRCEAQMNAVEDVYRLHWSVNIANELKNDWHSYVIDLEEASGFLFVSGNCCKFFSSLEYFCQKIQVNDSLDFIQKLSYSLHPLFDIMTKFDYGELLAYKSIVHDILLHSDIEKREYGFENLLLAITSCKIVNISFQPRDDDTYQISVYMDGIIDMVWFPETQETISNCSGYPVLVSLFEEFIENKYSAEEITRIPEISEQFLTAFLSQIFVTSLDDSMATQTAL